MRAGPGGTTGPSNDEPPGDGGGDGPAAPGGDQPLAGGPGVVVGEPRIRRCYRVTLTNRTGRVVADLTFHTPGGQASIIAAPDGWAGAVGPDGFRFDAADPAAQIQPGRRVGPFEFCREGEAPLRGQVALWHPDGGPDTPVTGDDVNVGGKQPATDSEGNVVIPATRRQYVYEVTMYSGSGGQSVISVDVRGARVRLDGDDAVSANGTAGGSSRPGPDHYSCPGPADRAARDLRPGGPDPAGGDQFAVAIDRAIGELPGVRVSNPGRLVLLEGADDVAVSLATEGIDVVETDIDPRIKLASEAYGLRRRQPAAQKLGAAGRRRSRSGHRAAGGDGTLARVQPHHPRPASLLRQRA